VTVYDKDPVAQARSFAAQGAEWIHVVDLDGARSGVPTHTDLIRRIIEATKLNVEVGGGVRSLAAIEDLLKAGAKRVVLGTKLVREPEFARQAAAAFSDAICAGVDARNGEVAIEGWYEGAGLPAAKLVEELASWGIRHLVYTDIARDGMQTGIDAEAYADIARVAGFPVIVSGGLSSLDDLRALSTLDEGLIEGVIAGRALYEKAFSVAEALDTLAHGKHA
jgi:phosphoribosylformimino-5-aminoimidazole carboxamide ribotide isomerase